MQKLSSPIDLIKKSVNIFVKKENLVYLTKIYIPAGIISLFIVAQSYLPTSITNSNSVWWIGAVVIIQILSALIGIFVTVSGIIALEKILNNRELSVKKTYVSAWKKYWKFVLFCAVTGVIYLLGLALLIIPAILFSVWFIFSRFIIIEKGLGIKESLLKSKEMVKGIFWKILGRLIVFGAFTIIVQMTIGIIPFGIGSILVGLSGALYLLPSYLLYQEISA